ncbi:MAG: hypothetical protein M5U20_11805 [Phycisphaerales bacterium]|nr:hypothetical protein [Phycisphaerales bacterium]
MRAGVGRGRRGVAGRGALSLSCATALTPGVLSVSGCGPETGGPIEVRVELGEPGGAPGQFAYPRCIDADGESLWVIDKTARVQRLDPRTGECLASFRMPEWELGKPVGITAAPFGDPPEPALYIADTHYHRLMVYRPPTKVDGEATLLASVGRYGKGEGEFIYPTDVAVVTTEGGGVERVYVAEYGGNDRVSVFDARLNFLFAFGAFGSGGGVEFNRPQSIAWEPTRREIIVADSCNHRVGRFTPEGALVAWYGSPAHAGAEPGRFRYPYGLAVLPDRTALVAEFGNSRVQRIDLDTGDALAAYGRAGRGRGELAYPWGVAVLERTVFVLDSGNGRVLGFDRPSPRTVRAARHDTQGGGG